MFYFDVNADNFEEIVIKGSLHTPVLVDFWAPWCNPCKTLVPILEKLADEFQGKFILAKVNTEDNSELATKFGIRGIPDVRAFRDGEIIDQFSGALPESAVREFIEKLIPNEVDILVSTAKQLLADNDITQAATTIDSALAIDADHSPAKLVKISLLLAEGNAASARDLLDTIPQKDRLSDKFESLLAKVTLAEGAQNIASHEELLADVNTNPDNLQARFDLANYYIAQEQFELALDLLFYIIQHDRHFNDDIGRKTVLSVFTLLGNQGDLVRDYRKRLASLLN